MDLIDQHQPDLLYSDGALPFDEVGRHMVAHLYNVSAKKNGRPYAVYNQKDKDPLVARTGVFDIEKGQSDTEESFPWQTDTCIANWFYDVRAPFKTARQVAETLVDIVSKNGNLLLNMIQLPDGSINEEADFLLKSLATWSQVSGEGIYGTRPWKVAGEGPSKFQQKARFEEKAVAWTSSDFRFTSKGKTVYAFQMKYPESREAYILKLGKSAGKIIAVSLLGSGTGAGKPATNAKSTLEWRQHEDCLYVKLPVEKVCEYVPCFKVELGS